MRLTLTRYQLAGYGLIAASVLVAGVVLLVFAEVAG